MPLTFHALPSDTVAEIRAGAPDANGQPAEHIPAIAAGMPCRHCLRPIPKGAAALVLAYRPFDGMQPYAELGPIFLCAEACGRGGGDDALPEILQGSPDYLVKAYGQDQRIIYGTGAITPKAEVKTRAAALLSDPGVAFVDIRSARNNCFLTRVTR